MITSPDLEIDAPKPDFQIPAAPVAAVPSVEVPREVAPPPKPAPVAEVKVPDPAPSTPITVSTEPEKPKVEAAHPVELPAKKPTSPVNQPKKKPAPTAAKPQRSGLISFMLVLLLLFLGGGAAVIFVSKEIGKNVEPPALKAAPVNPTVNEANYIRIGWQKDAYDLLGKYLAATTAKEKLPYILNADALAPKIEDFYGGGTIIDSDTPADAFSIYELSEEDRKRGLFMMIYDQPPQFDMKEFFRPLASLEVQYGVEEADLLLSTVARVGNFAMEPLRVHAFFKRTPAGLKLDWEIFAQTKYRMFQNFVEIPEVGQSGVFRVFIVEDVPDKGRAVAGARAYRLADPANTGDSARVNVKIDSEVGRALSIINWRGTKENHPITRTATVEFKWVGEKTAPELEISRLICWEFLGLGGKETPATASTK
ncbi:MAG: hypothetical protein ABI162_11475 [Luteolibacter sp.]